jgi:SAM-dependent methyltransferase
MSTKIKQGKLWSSAPEYWSKYFEPYFMPLYQKALEQLRLTEDTLLLDAGCGSGLFSGLAIRAGAGVTGIDAAPGLLEVARRRNPESRFLEEDLESLPFKSDSFDVVTGFNSFQYAGNVKAALAEAKRVLQNSGRLVIGIWDAPEMSDATIVLKAIGSLLPPPVPGAPGPFELSENSKLEKMLESVGLKVVFKEKVPCPFLYQDIQQAVNSFMGTGPAAAASDFTGQKMVEEAISRALEPFAINDHMYFLQNHFQLLIAEK